MAVKGIQDLLCNLPPSTVSAEIKIPAFFCFPPPSPIFIRISETHS